MSTVSTPITTIASTDTVSASRSTINTNFVNRTAVTIRSIADADSPYTVATGDDVVLGASTAALITVNLPTALSAKHRVITFVTTVATGGGIEIFANGAETINGVTNQNIYNQYDSLTIVSNGTAWYIIAAMP